MSNDRERFESDYAEIVYRLANYSNFLRDRNRPPIIRAVGKRIQDEIRAALLERRSDDS